jgi:hypothetical protein
VRLGRKPYLCHGATVRGYTCIYRPIYENPFEYYSKSRISPLYFKFKPLFSFNLFSEVGWGSMMGDKSQSLGFGEAHYDPYQHLFTRMVK